MSKFELNLDPIQRLSLGLYLVGLLFVALGYYLLQYTEEMAYPVTAAVLSITYWHYVVALILVGIVILILGFITTFLSMTKKQPSKA